MSITDRFTVRLMVVILLVITPLFTFNEIRFFIFESVNKREPSIYVKAIKDIFFLFLMLIATFSVIKTRKVSVLSIFYVLLANYVALLFLISLGSNYYMAFAGIRWVFPLFLSFLLIPYVDDSLLATIAKVLAFLFILHFLLQIYELSFMKSRVQNSWGMATRVPGLFSNPNTAGFFTMVTLFFSYMYLPRSQLRYLLFLLLTISIYFTLSGTAFIVLFIFIMMIVLGKKYINILILTAPFTGYFCLSVISLLLSNRDPNWIKNSLGTRLELALELLRNSEFLPSHFGFATNTATNLLVTFGGDRSLIFAADSTYNSIIGNTGIMGLMIFLLIYFFWILTMIRLKRMDMYLFTMIYSLYGISIIITESFPMNLLFSIMVAYFLRSVFSLTPVPLKEKAGI